MEFTWKIFYMQIIGSVFALQMSKTIILYTVCGQKSVHGIKHYIDSTLH